MMQFRQSFTSNVLAISIIAGLCGYNASHAQSPTLILHGEADDTPVGKLAKLKGVGMNDLPEGVIRKVKGNCHPIVRTHPGSGEKALYCDPSYSIGIEGLSEPEADALLGFLSKHMTQPAFTCRLRWAPKTLAVWDNRISIHQAFNDYDGHRRELYRTTIAGEAPA